MVSIIVPVYNSEKYLQRCIDSVLAQTYSDFELILIDDGSTDLSAKICDNYTIQDNRVRCIHKSNAGVSSARNTGLSEARGEWLVFVDSDDWISPLCIEKLNGAGDADFVTCYYTIDNCDSFISHPFMDKRYDDRRAVIEFVSANFSKLTYLHCRRYKKSIVDNYKISFNTNVHYAEDLLFNLQYLNQISSVVAMSDILYHYEKHTSSLSARDVPWNDMSSIINMVGQSVEMYEWVKLSDRDRLLNYYIWNLVRKYIIPIQNDGSIKMLYKSLKLISANRYVSEIFKNQSSSKSFFRRCLDFTINNRLYAMAALLMKAEKYVLMLDLKVRN